MEERIQFVVQTASILEKRGSANEAQKQQKFPKDSRHMVMVQVTFPVICFSFGSMGWVLATVYRCILQLATISIGVIGLPVPFCFFVCALRSTKIMISARLEYRCLCFLLFSAHRGENCFFLHFHDLVFIIFNWPILFSCLFFICWFSRAPSLLLLLSARQPKQNRTVECSLSVIDTFWYAFDHLDSAKWRNCEHNLSSNNKWKISWTSWGKCAKYNIISNRVLREHFIL